MDNRPIAIKMTPKGRRKIRVSTDIVTGGLRGMQPDLSKLSLGTVDSFSLGIGKAIAKGVTKLTTKDPIKEKEKLAKIDAAYNKPAVKTASNIMNAIGTAALGVLGVKALKGDLKKDTPKAPPAPSIDTSAFKRPSLVKSVTPMISPLPPSVPASPGDANIEAAVQESERNPGNLGSFLAEQAEKIDLPTRQEILSRGQQIFDSGKQGILSKAQKQLQDLSTQILPKTKAVKDAEVLFTTPQTASMAGDASMIGGLSPMVLVGIAVALGAIIYLANR